MIISIYFILSWLIIASVILSRSELPLKVASFLYLVACLVHTHMYILIPENFKGFTVSESPPYYLSFILWRTLIVPAFIVLIFKFMYKPFVKGGRLLLFAGLFTLSMSLVEGAGEILQLYTFKWWNFYWSLLYYGSMFLFSYLLSIWFERMEEP